MSRIIKGNQRLSEEGAIKKIANVLETAPGCLRGGSVKPDPLTGVDILFFVALRKVLYISRRGLSAEYLRKMVYNL